MWRRPTVRHVDFALGRFGAILLEQGRLDDAKAVLEQAVERKTDIPAVWSDHLRVLADGRDLDGFTLGVEPMKASVRYPVEWEFILA